MSAPEPGELSRRRSQALAIDHALAVAYPDAWCELRHSSPYELLVATILSAQCTDARVNQVTPALFARYPDPAALAAADPAELEELIRPTGFFRNKARALLGMARAIAERFAGRVPATMEELTSLPGVGRKTANVILGTGFGIAAGIVVDTHVARLSRRLGLTRESNPERIEDDLKALFPPSSWILLAHRLIIHGRRVCTARRPACDACPLAHVCPRLGVAEATIPSTSASRRRR
ncbi:MAG: endonuclease III [Acidobacteriota bacterium]|jgi:endonuclease-3